MSGTAQKDSNKKAVILWDIPVVCAIAPACLCLCDQAETLTHHV